MRGMPVPATFGYPGTDGSWLANYVGYLSNINPVVSPLLAHPMHPFSRVERAVITAVWPKTHEPRLLPSGKDIESS